LFLIFFGLLALVPSEGQGKVALQPAGGNVASRHLAGEWRLLPELSQRLTGAPTGGPDLVAITSDPSVLDSLPPQIEVILKPSPVYMAGTLTFAKARFVFLLTEQEGSQRLLCFQSGTSGSGALSIFFDVIPAKEPQNDLLFLGGDKDGQPFFAYERVSLPKTSGLSEATRTLLLDALANTYSPSLEKLTECPDWQGAVDLLIEEVRSDPNGPHNNHCIVLQHMVTRHLAEIRLDVEPLLAVLQSRSWTNQQKTADVLAEAVRRPDLFKGNEKKTIRSLIPLTGSQRGPVVKPALQVLHALAGMNTPQRDPLGWARWFYSRFGEKIDLSGSVYELVAVIASENSPDGTTHFKLEEQRLKDKVELRSRIQAFISRARTAGLRPRFVALVPTPVTSTETQDKAIRDAQPIRDVLGTLGIEEITLAPEGTTFYPPFEAGFPARPVS
jgi:hypothetical protein